MIYDYFRVTGAHDTVLDYADLFSVPLHCDNIQEFDKRCDEVLLLWQKFDPMISWKVCTNLGQVSLRNSKLHDTESHQKRSMPNYQKLKTMVQSSIDQKLRLRNFGARHGKIDTGAVVKNRKRTIGVEGGKGTCFQWKEKKPPHLLSHPCHEVEVC